jgi:disulfide bond formation protein DsbB
MRAMMPLHTRTLALLAAIGAGLALAVAWLAQAWLGLAPCALCLVERWPYRVVIVLCLLAMVLPHGVARALLWLAVLAVLADVAIAVVHVGVEQHAWPSPLPGCAAPAFRGGSIAEMLKSMPVRPAKPCDSPSFLIPGLPLSMAVLNLVFGMAFAVLLSVGLWCSRRKDA